ncbi:hypothetical protein [Seonamhaeicola sp. ML3]|uniref:hypothetical protein n=1 Tax=Seonamhaeicola sp. ML3 TaxID=2937786 RepID=UPI00200E5286|nr:hypothetical protein [Seonamhaeicola sp. ML3]
MNPQLKPTIFLIALMFCMLNSCSNNDTTPLSEEEPDEIPDQSEFTIYSDQDYPDIPSFEIPDSAQRYIGGPNADDSNNGSKSAPWATFDKGLRELAVSSSWYCLNLASDLSIDSPIDTKFYGPGPGTPSQFVYIRSDPSVSTPITLTINARVEIDGQQHWLWYGFKMRGTEGVNIGDDRPTYHHTIRNIQGNMSGQGGDNHGFFQALNYNANYFGVFNCDFTGPGTTNDGIHGNTAAIIAFRVTHMRLENNRISNTPRPLYYKHSNQPAFGTASIHIRNNYHKAEGIGEYCFFAGRAEAGTFEISNNIFEGYVEISNGGGSEQPEGHFISHNTFLSDLKIQNGNDPVINATITNNIIAGKFEILRYHNNVNTNTSNYQLYGDHIYYQTHKYTLEEWQASSIPSNQDTNSLSGQPQFLENQDPPKHYELAPNSTGKQAASDGEDIGANTSYVGVKQ